MAWLLIVLLVPSAGALAYRRAAFSVWAAVGFLWVVLFGGMATIGALTGAGGGY